MEVSRDANIMGCDCFLSMHFLFPSLLKKKYIKRNYSPFQKDVGLTFLLFQLNNCKAENPH